MNRALLSASALLGASGLLLVDSAIKGAVILGFAGFVALMFKRDSAATRHLVWLVAIVAMLVVPLFSAVLPEWQVLPAWAVIAPEAVDAEIFESPDLASVVESYASEQPAAELPSTASPIEYEVPAVTDGQLMAEVADPESVILPAQVIPVPDTLADTSWSFVQALSLVWAFGFCVLMLRLMAARSMLWSNERRATVIALSQRALIDEPPQEPDATIVAAFQTACRKLGVRQSVRLLIHPDRMIPVIWGIVKVRLLLPAAARQWSVEQLNSVLLHELAHFRRRDTFAQLLAQVACALHWFNPLVWVAAWRLHEERERACDDLVLANGVAASTYAEHLLNVATRLSSSPWTQACGLAMARKSSLESRLRAVLSEKLNRRGVTRAIGVAALVFGTAVAVPLAMLRANVAPLGAGEGESADEGDPPGDEKSAADDQPAEMTPQHEDAQKLFKRWQANARTDGNIPGALIGILGAKVQYFISLNKEDSDQGRELSLKFEDLLPRFDPAHDWTQADAVGLLNDVSEIHSIPLDTTFDPWPDRVIAGGEPLPPELVDAAWGQPLPDGLRVAWYLEPPAKEYALGTSLKSRILVYNSGEKTAVFIMPTWQQGGSQSGHAAVDGKDAVVNVSSVYWTTMARMKVVRLAPGEYCEAAAPGMGIGGSSDNDDGAKVRVGSWIEAKADDDVRFSPMAVEIRFAPSVVGTREWGDSPSLQDPKDADDLWKKLITHRVQQELPIPAGAADREQLLRRATMDLFGEQPSKSEIAAFVADELADATNPSTSTESLVARLLSHKPDIVPFTGALKPGEIRFRVIPPPKPGEKLDAATEARLLWGEPVDGLRAALVMRPLPGETKEAGPSPDLYVVWQNVSDAPIRLNDTVPSPRLRTMYLRIDGEIMFGMGTEKSAVGDVLLQPREVTLSRLFSPDRQTENGLSTGELMAVQAMADSHRTMSVKLEIEQAPAGAWTGKLTTGEASGVDAAFRPRPNSEEGRELLKAWHHMARRNGDIPGGLIKRLGVNVKQHLVDTGLDGTSGSGAKTVQTLARRLDDSRDRTLAEVSTLMDDIAAVSSVPLSNTLEEIRERTFQRGTPLPDELKDAPWGKPQPNGLRAAWLLEPETKAYRLGTSLKSRILIHNSGKNRIVFRTRTWHQGEHTARTSKSEDLDVSSTDWLTRGRLIHVRLWPGEYITVNATGIGIGTNQQAEDWQTARVGAWIDTKSGDTVTLTTKPVLLRDWNDKPALIGESRGWHDFIFRRLQNELPLPTDPDERKHLVYRAGMDLFGTPLGADEIAAFVNDPKPDAIASLAKRLSEKQSTIPVAGSLTSGTTTLRVLSADPDAANRPRVAASPGRYILGDNVRLLVEQYPNEWQQRNKATIKFYASPPNTTPPGKPYTIWLPQGWRTYAIAWERDSTVLWIAQKGVVRSYDITNPEDVKETRFETDGITQVPKPLLEQLRSVFEDGGRSSVPPPPPAAASAP